MAEFNRKEKEKEQENGNSYLVDVAINCADHDLPLFEVLDKDPDDGRMRVRLMHYVIIAKENLTPEMKDAIKPLFKNFEL